MSKLRLIDLYHPLPGPLKNLAASLHGYRLKSWRYGKETERWVAEAQERESWSEEQWQAWQEERLAFILERAAQSVPYYRAQWQARRRAGDRGAVDRLENWPVLSKESVRANNRALLAEDCAMAKMYRDRTSGTTGSPLNIYLKRQTVQMHYAIYEQRVRRWNQVSYRDCWGIFGGQMIVRTEQKTPPYWIYNAGMKQVYFSTFHINPETTEAYLGALERFRPTHLVAYPTSLCHLARCIQETGRPAHSPKVIISNAETLSDEQRDLLSAVFRCRVQNTYGMAELAAFASECQAGRLHLWPELGYTEVLSDEADAALPAGESGRIIGTSLLNADMPLIRYETGDRGALAAPAPCACGRGLPVIERLEGRKNDAIQTADGRRIFWLNPAFYGLAVHEAQIIQESLEHVRVLVVPGAGFNEESSRTVLQRLQERLGKAMRIEIQTVTEIPRQANGKFKAVVSKLA